MNVGAGIRRRKQARLVYVGTFAKTLFPALRLGFLILPRELVAGVHAARRAADVHPPTLDQAVLADLMAGGHYDTHLRRMRSAYRERLEALNTAARRHCDGLLAVRPARTGLHVVADLRAAADAGAVARRARELGVEVMPVSAYYLSRCTPVNALVLGFGCVRPDDMDEGMRRLASAIESVDRAKSTAVSPAPKT